MELYVIDGLAFKTIKSKLLLSKAWSNINTTYKLEHRLFTDIILGGDEYDGLCLILMVFIPVFNYSSPLKSLIYFLKSALNKVLQS